jgi:transposase
MKNAVRYVGLDLAKRTMEICILADGQKTIRISGHKSDEGGRNRLAALLKKTDIIGMEACTYAFVLTRFLLKEVGCTVYILNPGKLVMIWKSTRKTDKDDAQKIASFIQRYPEEELPLVQVPSEQEETMRTLVSMKNYQTKLRTSLINRLHALYVQAGITTMKKSHLAASASRKEQSALLPDFLSLIADMIEQELAVVENHLHTLEEKISTMVREHALAPYVMSIPGVGTGVAGAFLAYVGDGSRFSKVSEVANYVGLVPRLDCSGDTNRYGSITKMGCRALRGIILQSVWSLIQTKEGGRLNNKYFLLAERMSNGKSAVAIARKLVGLMWTLVTRRQLYADASREHLERKFRYYKLNFEGWDALAS